MVRNPLNNGFIHIFRLTNFIQHAIKLLIIPPAITWLKVEGIWD